MEYNLVLKKKEILPFTKPWMNLEDIMLNEIWVYLSEDNSVIPLA